ncbi:MAG: hypothetical protein QOF35_39, partial [Actinomycetota bacterium]|nr:hypothetical protein [Actinomycetota bacterium]
MADLDKPATSSSDEKPKAGIFERAFDSEVERIDQKHPWYELPEPLGLLELIGIRNTLRRENLTDTSRLAAIDPVQPPPFEERFTAERTSDGSWNDLVHGEMGMAGTRFGRNVPVEATWPDRLRILDPSPREISRRLMTRDNGIIPASAGNALIASWLQFMLHDWVKHGASPTDNPWVIPLLPGDAWPEPPLQVMRTPDDPTSPPDSDLPPTHINVNTHWWDGSQIYGNDLESQTFLRAHAGGKLRLVDGLPPVPDDRALNPVYLPGFWVGMGMMQTLFAMEHNAVCDMLAAKYPQ